MCCRIAIGALRASAVMAALAAVAAMDATDATEVAIVSSALVGTSVRYATPARTLSASSQTRLCNSKSSTCTSGGW